MLGCCWPSGLSVLSFPLEPNGLPVADLRTVVKDVLHTGVFRLPTGERWECRPEFLRAAVVNGNGMLASGHVAAPLIWEHDLTVDPVPLAVLLSSLDDPRTWAAGVARGTFGYAARYKLETVRGEPVALAAIRVHDDADLKQFEKTRFVSARVNFDHTDTNGRHWPGASIGHIAATPQPVQMKQRPVGWPWGVMLSATLPGRRSRCSVFLSDSYREGAAMAGENGGGGGDNSAPKKRDGGIGELISELANHDIIIPDGVATDVASLTNALKVVSANKQGEANGNGNTPNDLDDLGGAGAQPVGGGGAMPAMLSTNPAGKILLDDKRNQLLGRLRRVEGDMVKAGTWTAPVVKQMEKTIRDMPEAKLLSVIQHGGAVSRVIREIEIAERLQKGKPLEVIDDDSPGSVNLSGMRPVPAPSHPGAPDPAKQEAEIKQATEAARARVAARIKPAETTPKK